MLRVTEAEGPARTIITIDGRLSSDYVALIENSCNKAQSKGKEVQLFLRDVATIDEAGRALLRRLGAKGVQLLGKGVYTSYVLQALCPAATQG
jgi:ABC-type transporter Mla MlaB component